MRARLGDALQGPSAALTARYTDQATDALIGMVSTQDRTLREKLERSKA